MTIRFAYQRDQGTLFGPDSRLHLNFLSDSNQLLRTIADDSLDVPGNGTSYQTSRKPPCNKRFHCDVVHSSVVYHNGLASRKTMWEDWTATTCQLRDVLRQSTSEQVNSVIVDVHVGLEASVTPHRAGTRDLVSGSSILTVSLGAPRVLRLVPKDGSGTIDILLPHGSLFVLGWKTNATYKHALFSNSDKAQLCFSLTYRSIASRWFPKENARVRPPHSYMASVGWDVCTWQAKVPRWLAKWHPDNSTQLCEQDIAGLRAQLPSLLRAGRLGKRTRQEYEGVVDEAFTEEMRRRRSLRLYLPAATPNSFKEVLQRLAQFAVSHDLVRLDQRFPNERLAHSPESMYHHLSLEDVMKVDQVLCRTEDDTRSLPLTNPSESACLGSGVAPIVPVVELVGCAVFTYQKEGRTNGFIYMYLAGGEDCRFAFTLEDGVVTLSQVEARDGERALTIREEA